MKIGLVKERTNAENNYFFAQHHQHMGEVQWKVFQMFHISHFIEQMFVWSSIGYVENRLSTSFALDTMHNFSDRLACGVDLRHKLFLRVPTRNISFANIGSAIPSITED